MINVFASALQKVVDALDSEGIAYMIVGGFAVSYHNRTRTTNDIDLVLQISPEDVSKLLKHFPFWEGYEESFKEDIKMGIVFNIVDFDTGIRYDFMTFEDSIYNKLAFGRRKKVNFFGVSCYISSLEDLIISKLKWYNLSPSDKQMEDLKFLFIQDGLDRDYLNLWISNLNLKTHGLLGE